MSHRDNVEVVGKAIVLIVLITSFEFLVMHDPEIYSLDRVVGVKGVWDPMLTIVVSTSSYLDFISYAVALASLRTIDLDWRRRSSCVESWVRSDVCLNIGSIGCVVGDITSGVDLIVCWGVSHRIGWSIGRSVGSRVDRLCYFISALSFFSHRIEGTLAMMSLVRTLRSASGIGTWCRSTISGTSFIDLNSYNTDVGLEAPDRWRIFKVV
jgi:hypothetical protein